MSSYPIGDQPELSVRFSSGRFRLRNGPLGEIQVEISGRPEDGLVVEQHGDRIEIVQRPDLRRARYDVIVTAPTSVRLDVSVANADVDIDAVHSADLRTASGTVRLGHASTDVFVKAASGDIRVDKVGGDLRVSAASGDCSVGSVGGMAQITCASGDIRIDDVGGDAEFKTASGDVEIGCCTGGRLSAKSASGDVSVGIPRGTSVSADLFTMSGSMHLPKTSRHGNDGRDGPGRPFDLRVRSMSGDITINPVES